MAEYYIRRITVRNKLNAALTNVKVVYGQSKKETGLLAYAFDWRSVDVETGHLILGKTEVPLPDIPVDGETGVDCAVRFVDGNRGYWQVYFEKDNKRFKINKNNAQVNPWPQDDGKYLEVTIRHEGNFIRLDFVMDSGNAYFYAIDYCFRSMAKTYSCLLLHCLIHQLLCSFALPSVVSHLGGHVSCGKTIKGGRTVSCRTHDFPRLILKLESLSSPLSPSSKKPDHVTVDIISLETFLYENETAELSAAVQDQSLFQALGKIINPMINDSQQKVIDAKDEEDLGDSAGSTGANSPEASQPEENGQRKIAEAKDDALNENNVGCVEGKCSVSCERICRVHSVGSNVLSSGEANGDEAESVTLETPASAPPPPPPTDPKPHRTQSPGAQVYHARQGIQALKAFSEDSESCCPLRLIFLFLGLCIARIEF